MIYEHTKHTGTETHGDGPFVFESYRNNFLCAVYLNH